MLRHFYFTHEEFFYEHATIRNTDFIPSSETLVQEDVKYIYWPDFRHEELYDLRGDSLEERNLAQTRNRRRRSPVLRSRLQN